MSTLQIVAWAAAAAAAIPAWTVLRNLARYRPPRSLEGGGEPVSVLIPARNEEGSIEEAVRSVLASRGIELEVLVGDDGSTDRTAQIVEELANHDARVRLIEIPPLPHGWCGKQHACHHLAESARFDVLVFVDADVRLEPSGLAGAAGFLKQSGAGLVSGVPRQITVTRLERWLLPLIHFVLLGFLPIGRMRSSTHPSYGAGCGQLMMARRDAYRRAGGHESIRSSLHDGVQLPRAFRRAGEKTDLFDAAPLATCRMYRDASEVWSGLGKNAIEGLGSPGTIGPATLLLSFGQIVPPALLVLAAFLPMSVLPALVGTLLVYLPRVAMARRFSHSADSVIAHPLGVALLLVIQWQSLLRSLAGGAASWKGRSYDGSPQVDPS